MASIFLTYVLWLFGGCLGLHHFYLGQDIRAFIYWSTFGYFTLGWISDIWKIPWYVWEEKNRSQTEQNLTKENKPPYSTSRFFSQIFLSKWYGLVVLIAIPKEPVFGVNPWFFHGLVPLGYAAGVYLAGNVDDTEGGFKWPLIGATISYPVVTFYGLDQIITAFVSTILFNRKEIRYRSKPASQKSFLRRISVLSCGAFLFLGLWTSYVYFNAEIVEADGEVTKVRDAVKNFLKSPMYLEFKQSLLDSWSHVQKHGWGSVWEHLADRLDPQGKKHSYKVLGLNESASEEEITLKWRKLSREWHPDKFKSQDDKEQAQEKFMEIQEAYETISNSKHRRTVKNQRETTEL